VPKLSPISRPKLIAKLKDFGFEGPHSGGNHQFMVRGTLRLTHPIPHRGDIGVDLLTRILRQANIDRSEW